MVARVRKGAGPGCVRYRAGVGTPARRRTPSPINAMKQPLVIYTLIYLVILLVHAIVRRPTRQRAGFAPGPAPRGDAELMLKGMVTDSLRFYVPFAAICLIGISFGKPGLLPQYLAWGIVGLQVLMWGALLLRQEAARLPLALLAIVLMGWLWVMELPFFNVIPR